MNEVQDRVAPPPAGLVPHPVSQQRGNDSKGECGGQAQSPGPCECPSRKKSQTCRCGQTHLVCEHRAEKDGVAVFHKKLDNRIHINSQQVLFDLIAVNLPAYTERHK
jgi:hypothetical protein